MSNSVARRSALSATAITKKRKNPKNNRKNMRIREHYRIVTKKLKKSKKKKNFFFIARIRALH